VAYQASGNRINGQANPLSFAALAGRAFELGKRAKKASCCAGLIAILSSTPAKPLRFAKSTRHALSLKRGPGIMFVKEAI
jgi:hypothetical protein